MAGLEDRLTALCEQAVRRVTGIDFVQVVDPHVQTLLRVFFVLDPDTLLNPLFTLPSTAFPPQQVEIVSVSGGELPLRVPVTGATWEVVVTPGGNRSVLELQVAQPGGFGPYRLTLIDEPARRFDRFFNGVEFSFKQGCPSVFDCRRRLECPPEDEVDWPVDYLARDFESLRLALLDFAAQRYPRWRERIPADAMVMLQELAAALGDELAWQQDRIAAEGSLSTLAERRSLWWHTRLVDYTPDEGESASTWLDVTMRPATQGFVPPGTRVWATPESEPAVPFETGPGLARQPGAQPVWLCDAWNAIDAHVPDPSQPCLPAGATEIYLVGHVPLLAQLPPGAMPGEFWLGRPVLIRSDPGDPALPRRAFVVHPTAVETTVDPLVLDGSGVPLPITRVAWAAGEALPHELCLHEATLHANLLPATAGATFDTFFAIHDNTAVASALRDRVGIAVERQGPLDEQARTRAPVYRHSMPQTVARGLGRLGGTPEVELQEVDATLAPFTPPRRWQHLGTLMAAQAEDAAFTLEHGHWGPVISFDRPAGRFVHRERAGGAGFTACFGDGEFGRTPRDGQFFRLRYRTDVGTRANLPEGSVTVLDDLTPPGEPAAPTLLGLAQSVTNPFAITSGRDPQPLEDVVQMAPEAFRADPRRAVRDEDYVALAQQLDWVQRAGATRRWTGSWLTEFVTVDPRGTVVLDDDHRLALEAEMDCVRQAGRPVVVRDPVYLPLDLRVRLCIQPGAYAGQVIERVLRALAGPGRAGQPVPFFDPDHFSFGDPLYRSALEAAIQSVPGVLAVDALRVRIRGWLDWQDFPGHVLAVAEDRILLLLNDPRRPEAGSLWVTTGSLV